MRNDLKRILAILLTLATCLGMLTACENSTPAETTEPKVTEPAEEAKVLKVLTLGHSLGNDTNWMLSMIAKAEGYQDMSVGFLYYSGCPLKSHVKFMNNDSAVYKLWLSSTATADQPPKSIENVTMKQAITHDYWDIIIMQGGVFEIAESATYTDGKIQLIQTYVNSYKKNPNAVFMWHMPWAPATEEALQKTYDTNLEKNSYHQNYKKYDNDHLKLYNAITKCVSDHIMTDDTFVGLIPTGTAFENALSTFLTEKDMHRDYVHATDLARVIAGYTAFCVLTGVKELKEIKLNAIPKQFFRSTKGSQDRVLTDIEKAIILESVNNALKNPLQVTQSQYTQAPAA